MDLDPRRGRFSGAQGTRAAPLLGRVGEGKPPVPIGRTAGTAPAVASAGGSAGLAVGCGGREGAYAPQRRSREERTTARG